MCDAAAAAAAALAASGSDGEQTERRGAARGVALVRSQHDDLKQAEHDVVYFKSQVN